MQQSFPWLDLDQEEKGAAQEGRTEFHRSPLARAIDVGNLAQNLE